MIMSNSVNNNAKVVIFLVSPIFLRKKLLLLQTAFIGKDSLC